MADDAVSPALGPVVVADDDPVSRYLVVQLLANIRMQNPVLEATDGQEAVERLQGAEHPALLLLDLNMPRMSGLDVLRWVRHESDFPWLPVVTLTASALLEEIDEAYELGVDSYLVKPVGVGALRDVLAGLGLPWAIVPSGSAG